MKKNHCKICGHYEAEFLFRAESRRYAPGEYFNLYQCKQCSGVCIKPHLAFTAIQKYYPDSYEPHDPKRTKPREYRESITKLLRQYIYGGRPNPVQKKNNSARKILSGLFDRLTYRSFPRPNVKGKLLDIGCGNGSYLAAVKELGWSGYGVEPNRSAARHAAKTPGTEIQKGDFETVAYPEKHFDVITMWHSLEHFSDPINVMRKARKLLKDDGVLIIGIPNFSSMDRIFFKESWNGLEIPLHAWHFTPDSIQNLLKESGFEVRRIIHTTRPSDMVKSFIYFLEDNYRLKSNKWLVALLFVISIPISICFSIFKRSSIIKVYAN